MVECFKIYFYIFIKILPFDGKDNEKENHWIYVDFANLMKT